MGRQDARQKKWEAETQDEIKIGRRDTRPKNRERRNDTKKKWGAKTQDEKK